MAENQWYLNDTYPLTVAQNALTSQSLSVDPVNLTLASFTPTVSIIQYINFGTQNLALEIFTPTISIPGVGRGQNGINLPLFIRKHHNKLNRR